MLTKAILTGGVLSVLAGSIVYFGTEGADALENDVRETTRVEETELAGAAIEEPAEVTIEESAAAVVETAEMTDTAMAEMQDPPKETSKPKTKWLDQYLKKSKPTPKADPIVTEAEIEEVEVEAEAEAEAEAAAEAMLEKKKRNHVKKLMKKHGSHSESKGTYIVSEGERIETLDVKDLNLDNMEFEDQAEVDALLDELGLDKDAEKEVQIRIVKKVTGKPSLMQHPAEREVNVDYDMVLTEAKKLLVTDMRNQAFLEIIDHSIDQDDVMQAADIVEELSSPELRDTARARIGVGLANRGDAEAAFAVLDELEIDELSAPIRLEIITALMATKKERKASHPNK